MIRNYFVLFIRNLLRQKLFSFINLMGLTVSLTATLLIVIYVTHELSYDRFHHHSDRLYRVNQTFIWGENNESQFSRTGPGVAHALKEELPEVELVTSLHTPGNYIVSYVTPAQDVISFEETAIFSADSNFFRVLNFPLLKGDPTTAFRHTNTLMLTKSTAEKYFGSADPMGKLLRLGAPNDTAAQTYEVTGVVDDVPGNSTIEFDLLLSSKGFDVERMHWSWIWTQLETFVLLKEGADMNVVHQRLAKIPEKRAEETLQSVMNTSFKEYVASGKKWELFLQPVSSLHLPSVSVIGTFPDTGNIKMVYSLIAAAIFIMILSCINFMNLSTAQFTRRVKEAAMRKILGLGKVELGTGYFMEALIFTLAALIAAVALMQMALPGFAMLTGKKLTGDIFLNPLALLSVALAVVGMAVVSSIYPAVFLSRFRPADAIKGKAKAGRDGSFFRNSLVVFQFAISLILTICTAVVFQQLRFVSEKDLGFDRENVVRLKHAEAVPNAESLAKEFERIPGVLSASRCTSTPPGIYGGDKFTADGMNGEFFSLNFTTADEQYVPTLGVRIKAGRNFSKDVPSDVNAVILNEAAVRRLGWSPDESSIGKKIFYPGLVVGFELVGIAEDFNYWTLAVDIEPMGIFHIDNKKVLGEKRAFFALRLKEGFETDWNTLSESVASTWKTHAAGVPFEYGFIDGYFDETFRSQQRFGYVLSIVASLAILIASLGLLGMIIYSLEQRTKEIGIRKVSGATSWNILSLVSGRYLRLIAIAFVIGAPASYYLMLNWLSDFSYRISPSLWLFAACGLALMLLATVIASYHSLKAAARNPVDVLRDE